MFALLVYLALIIGVLVLILVVGLGITLFFIQDRVIYMVSRRA